MLIIRPDLTIEISKYDNVKIAYCLDNDYKLTDGDKVIFQIRNRCQDIILTKVVKEFQDGVAYIHLTNNDTGKLDIRSYSYDIKVVAPTISLSSTMITQRNFVVKGGIAND